MSANIEEQIKGLVEGNDEVDFAPFGEGTSDDWILKTEKDLSLKLPSSYKWWLKNYGGGEVAFKEIFSIYEQDPKLPGGDIVYQYKLKNNEGDDKLYIMSGGHHEAYFDLSQFNNGEYPVIEDWDGDIKVHKTFLHFLASLIETHTE